jgi:hypothetical protein
MRKAPIDCHVGISVMARLFLEHFEFLSQGNGG